MRRSVKPILESLQRVYPKQLADSKWDNTGLLVDSVAKTTSGNSVVLLTIDLTTSVCDEALEKDADIVIAYHPFIFSGIKSISSTNPQHVSLLKLINAGVSVYSPHTAVDASPKGNAVWLANAVSDGPANQKSMETVQALSPAVQGQENAGYGRVVHLKEPVPLMTMVEKVKASLNLSTVQLIRSAKQNDSISSVATCAGSGSSVLRGVEADLWLTGELGHHEMLYLKESGTNAIVCGHSNTEREYLPVMRDLLLEDLKAHGSDAKFLIAETDHDPITYV